MQNSYFSTHKALNFYKLQNRIYLVFKNLNCCNKSIIEKKRNEEPLHTHNFIITDNISHSIILLTRINIESRVVSDIENLSH